MDDEKYTPEDQESESDLKKYGISIITGSAKMKVTESEANRVTARRVVKEVGNQINTSIIDDNRQIDN